MTLRSATSLLKSQAPVVSTADVHQVKCSLMQYRTGMLTLKLKRYAAMKQLGRHQHLGTTSVTIQAHTSVFRDHRDAAVGKPVLAAGALVAPEQALPFPRTALCTVYSSAERVAPDSIKLEGGAGPHAQNAKLHRAAWLVSYQSRR